MDKVHIQKGKKRWCKCFLYPSKTKKNQRKQKQIIVQSFRLLCWLIWYELRLLKTTVCKLCVSAFTYWQCDTTLQFLKNSHCVHEKCIHFSGLRFLSRGIGSVFACKYCVKGKVTVKRVRLRIIFTTTASLGLSVASWIWKKQHFYCFYYLFFYSCSNLFSIVSVIDSCLFTVLG